MKNAWSLACLMLLLTVRVGLAPSAGESTPPSSPPAAPALSGTVADADSDKPLAQARVEVYAQADPMQTRARHAAGDLMGEPLARGVTDGAGRFRLNAPAGRRLVVVAEASGRQRSFLARPIVLTAPGERDLGRLELPAGRKLTGRVVDASGKPVVSAKVMALAPRARAQRGAGAGFARTMFGPNQMPPYPDTARTGPDGTFALEGLPDRPVTVRAWAEGFAPGLAEDVRAATVTIRLETGHPLSGRVLAPDGKTPVDGAQVVAGDDGFDGVARTDSRGAFRFDRLRGGPASLVATISSIVAAPDEKDCWFAPSSPLKLTLPVAPQTAPATMKLRPGGVVKARAIDAETRGNLAGVALTLDAPGEDESRPAVTDATGDLFFTGVPVGNIRLRAEADGYLEARLDATPLAASQTRVWSAALRPAAALEGTVRDATGRPVAGARVEVSGPPPFALPMRLPIFFPIGVDPVITDAQGRFLLEKLPPRDELKVGVACEGFAPWELAGIKLRPGERRSGMEVLLDAGVMLTGRIVNGEGQPVAAAGVTARRRREGGPGGMVIRFNDGAGRPGGRGGARGNPAASMEGDELPAVLSGADGVFRVRGAKAGVWSVEVAARGFAPKTVGGLKLEESARALDAGDIALQPGVALRGRVVNAAGEPIAYARGALRRELSVVETFDTGADGLFDLEDLAPGDGFTLTVDADGYAAVEKRGLALPCDEKVVTLAPSSRVSGQVLDRETRRPIPDFSIAISRARGGGGGGMMVSMAIAGPETPFHSEDGTFLVEDVDPGKLAIAARAPGYKESALRDLEVPEGKDLDGLTFTLDRSATVSGTVLDDKGRPLSGVAVQKKETSSGGMMFRAGTGPGGGGGAVTDGDGSFVIGGLDRENLTLSFTHPDYEPAERDVDLSRDVEGLRVTLSRGATLTGIVLHEEDGSPVGGATVSAVAAGSDRFGGARSATTGPDGTFSIEALPAGRYTLRAESAGLRSASIDDVVVAAGATPPPYELRLGGGVTLTGTIAGVKDEELPQFTVRAVAGQGAGAGGFGTSAPVDASGRFEMKGMAAGAVTLIAASGFLGGKSATKTIQIPENTPAFDTTIEFPRGSKVEGDVSRGGRPVDGASVIFMNEVTRSRVSATTDASGHYAAEDLDDGEYGVDVLSLASGISHSTRVTVKGDRELDIELPLARLSGTVKDAASGEPLDGAVISINKENAAQPAGGVGFIFQQGARTDATGSWAIDGLDAGTYTLTARKDGYGFDRRAVVIAPTLQTDPIGFELSRVEGFSFRAVDAISGSAPRSLWALVTVGGGGDPLSPAGWGASSVFRGQIAPDATGLFRLDTLKPGTYRIVLGGRNIATETIENVRVPGPELTLSLITGGAVEVTAPALEPAQTAKAVLLDSGGQPVPVDTFRAEPSFILSPRTPATLIDIKPGAYRLRASLPGGGVIEKPVQVAAGQTARVAVP